MRFAPDHELDEAARLAALEAVRLASLEEALADARRALVRACRLKVAGVSRDVLALAQLAEHLHRRVLEEETRRTGAAS